MSREAIFTFHQERGAGVVHLQGQGKRHQPCEG